MKKLLVPALVILILSAGFAWAQTQTQTQAEVPDYKNTTVWKYKSCGQNFMRPKDEDSLVWHEDYVPVNETIENTRMVIVVYKPTKREVLDTEGKEKFVSVSRNSPWLLIDINTINFSETLFEYQNSAWKFVRTFHAEKESLEFMRREYGFRY